MFHHSPRMCIVDCIITTPIEIAPPAQLRTWSIYSVIHARCLSESRAVPRPGQAYKRGSPISPKKPQARAGSTRPTPHARAGSPRANVGIKRAKIPQKSLPQNKSISIRVHPHPSAAPPIQIRVNFSHYSVPFPLPVPRPPAVMNTIPYLSQKSA